MAEDDTWITLSSGGLRARIDPLGAQLSVLRDAAGRDLLWDGDPAFWNGRAPLLFPIVGTLAGGEYRLGDKRYALPRHGFARHKPFEVLSASRTDVLLRLQADPQTLAVYPFQFQLQVRFEVNGAALSVNTTVQNRGDTPMPASFGYHPGFRWPLPSGIERARHAIEFEHDEPAPIRRVDGDGLVTAVRHPSPIRARHLPLDDELFRDDAVILDSLQSRAVTYGADAGPRLTLRFPDTPYLGLWSKPGAPFVCIEPWHGMADREGFSGDFSRKPGVFRVPPGAQREFRMQVILTGE